MPAFRIPRPSRQPRTHARLNQSHPFARQLVAARLSSTDQSWGRLFANIRSRANVVGVQGGDLGEAPGTLNGLTSGAAQVSSPFCLWCIFTPRLVQGSGGFTMFSIGNVGAGDDISFSCTPFTIQANAERNFVGTGAIIGNSISGGWVIGRQYLALLRSRSNTDHVLHVYDLTKHTLEITGSSTNDISSVSFQDYVSVHIGSYSDGSRDWRVLAGGLVDHSPTDAEVLSVVKNPWGLFQADDTALFPIEQSRALRIPRPATQQPQGVPRINRGSPLTNGLRALFCPSAGQVDLVNNVRFLTSGAPSIVGTTQGRAVKSTTSGASYDGWYAPEQTSGSRSATLYDPVAPPITVFSFGVTTVNASALIGRGNGSGTQAFSVGIYNGSWAGGRASVRTNDGTITFNPSSFVFDTARPSLTVLSVGASTTRMRSGYIGQILDAPADQSTPTGNFYYEYNDIYRCLSVAGSYLDSGTVLLAGLVVGEAWNDTKIAAFFKNPWQLFEEEDYIFVPTAGGATTVTATASLGAAIRATQSATANLGAAIQVVRTATANLGAAVAVTQSITTSLGAAVAATQNSAVNLGAAVQAAQAATANLGAAIQTSPFISASVGAAIAAAVTAAVNAGAAIAVARTAGADLGAVVRLERTLTASLNAYIQAVVVLSGATVTSITTTTATPRVTLTF